jgi:hypothetical protein
MFAGARMNAKLLRRFEGCQILLFKVDKEDANPFGRDKKLLERRRNRRLAIKA